MSSGSENARRGPIAGEPPRSGFSSGSLRRKGPGRFLIPSALSLAILLSLDLAAQSRRDPGNPGGRQGVPGEVRLGDSESDPAQEGMKSLAGQVVDKQKNALPQAVVHLKNKKTLAVKTFITDEGGNYRFVGLDRNTDYAVHAVYKGNSSPARTVSSFDDRKEVYLVLEIETSK